MEIEVLPDGELPIEGEPLGHVADPGSRGQVVGVHRITQECGLPSVAGISPVRTFMVVDLPQPLEPRKPKISPRPMAK